MTCTWGGQRRGYSSCGNVATSASWALIPPWNPSSGGSPTAARVSFISRRPRRRPLSRTGSQARQAALPSLVRGGCAPKEKNGIPGSCTGYTWGISVAHCLPAFSAARAGATVSTSLTTTSGRNSSISGNSALAASAADAPSGDPGGGGGNVLYSSAAVNPRPSASTGSRHRSHVSTSTS